ncbi:hypothetical protein PM082_019273 [Marasmius tenuissimus]|nr:hypothetical protein PM082_019273 [Marasmius tenuissimus]
MSHRLTQPITLLQSSSPILLEDILTSHTGLFARFRRLPPCSFVSVGQGKSSPIRLHRIGPQTSRDAGPE